MKLLAAGKSEEAEDVLAEAFGNVIHRCKDEHGRLLVKITIPIACTDEELSKAKAWSLRVVEYRLREEDRPNTNLSRGEPAAGET